MRLRLHSIVVLVAMEIVASAAFAGTTYYNIEDMSGWSSCGACAGINGSGPVATFWMKHQISSPSLDGSSTQFYIGGVKYADALWWKQLGGNNNVHHFTYDLYFYLKSASVPQALEFDVNQSTGTQKYIFGTECAIAAGHVWKIWNTAGKYWVNTYRSCYPQSYAWNHLTIQVERVSGQTHFISITLNGSTSYLNKYYSSRSSSSYEVNVAFQMDLNSNGTAYSTWIDKMTLTDW